MHRLDTLVNLEELDLRDNELEAIEGLDALTKLTSVLCLCPSCADIFSPLD